MFTRDLAAHDLEQLVLQATHFARELFEARVGNLAYLRIFQCDGVATVALVADAVEAKEFTTHLKTRHLVAPVFGQNACLKEAGPYDVQRIEGVATAKQQLATLEHSTRCHHLVDTIEVGRRQSDRQA